MLHTLTKSGGKTIEDMILEIQEEMGVRKTKEVFLLFMMGSQTDGLIAAHLAKLGVFCLAADPATITAEDVRTVNPTGIILSGGPGSMYNEPPPFDFEIFNLGIPVLGICLGFQMWASHIGASVVPGDSKEYGRHLLRISNVMASFGMNLAGASLLRGIPKGSYALQSHGDRIEKNTDITVLASTDHSPVSAGFHKHLCGVQFHPEVTDTDHGDKIFENFCFTICGAKDRYPAQDIAKMKVSDLRNQIGDKKGLLALSGGSDSSVCAGLLQAATEGRHGQLQYVYIKGIDRPDDEAHVIKFFGNIPGIELRIIDGTEEFLSALKGKKDSHAKRLAVRKVYNAILNRAIAEFGAQFIVQGTLYTDISESGKGHVSGARKARIKLHHNVDLKFDVPEIMPLADCVKDSARDIGRAIGVHEELLTRHPFPGPGLVVRIEGVVTKKKLEMARVIDGIFIEELHAWGLYHDVWQAGVNVLNSFHTWTKGDDAGKGRKIELFAVNSVNGFTAQWSRLSFDFLDHVSKRITNEVPGVGSVSYRISSKPPTTIEQQ